MKTSQEPVESFNPVPLWDDDEKKVIGECRWNEILIDVVGGKSLPAWKWQKLVQSIGEVEVVTSDGSLRGVIWPRK